MFIHFIRWNLIEESVLFQWRIPASKGASDSEMRAKTCNKKVGLPAKNDYRVLAIRLLGHLSKIFYIGIPLQKL